LAFIEHAITTEEITGHVTLLLQLFTSTCSGLFLSI